MQQDNNIQQKLQQLENQQLPDLSQMDRHWEGMQQLLQPANTVVKAGSGFTKLVSIIAAIAVVVAGVFVAVKLNEDTSKESKNISHNSSQNTNTDQGETTIIDSSFSTATDTTIKRSLPPKPVLLNQPIFADVSIESLKNGADSFEFTDIVNDSGGIISQQELFTNLFQQLSKPAQHFFISNKRDTMLVCEEGTVVMVPANSFAGEDSVDFEITEFYDYSDMVMNRLTTMSDTNQLISGGMLRINAYRKDSLINLNLKKQLKVFVPGITEKDSMQIFEGKKDGETMDGAGPDWKLTGIKINRAPQMKIGAINFVDDIYEGRSFNRRTKRIFRQSYDSKLSRKELTAIMKERYPKYSKIVVKRSALWLYSWQRWFDVIGNKGQFFPEQIQLHNLTPIDTTYDFAGNNVNSFWQNSRQTAARFNWGPIKDKYNIDINRLGWINCDRFYKTPGRKTEFYVNMKNKASNYFTVMVFDKFKSVMGGFASGNTVRFERIPVGAAVKIISIGVNGEGKTVMAMKKAVIKKDSEIDLDFEEHDSKSIKASLSILNK